MSYNPLSVYFYETFENYAPDIIVYVPKLIYHSNDYTSHIFAYEAYLSPSDAYDRHFWFKDKIDAEEIEVIEKTLIDHLLTQKNSDDMNPFWTVTRIENISKYKEKWGV